MSFKFQPIVVHLGDSEREPDFLVTISFTDSISRLLKNHSLQLKCCQLSRLKSSSRILFQ